MKIIIYIIIIYLSFSSSVLSQTYEDGLQAIENKNYVLAYSILKQLAENEDPYAMRELGKMYARGDWVEPNMVVAMEWWMKCALMYNFECMTTLGWTRYKMPGYINVAYAHYWYTLASYSPNQEIRDGAIESLRVIEAEMTLEQFDKSAFLFKNTSQFWNGILD
jgi:TPR repeat protein